MEYTSSEEWRTRIKPNHAVLIYIAILLSKFHGRKPLSVCIFPRISLRESGRYTASLTQEDHRRLSTFQHGVCKAVLNLPKLTRSDMCEQLMDILPIHAEIDARKLMFLGRLCNMSTLCLSKQIFISRLFSFLTQLVADPRGFIPDIIDILRKYNLHTYLLTWMTTGTFPHKYSWKTIVRSTINDFHIQQRQIRMLMDPDFHRFNSVFQHNKPCNIWSFVDNASDIRNFKFICKLIVSTKTLCLSTCHLCNSTYEDIFFHVTLSCGAL